MAGPMISSRMDDLPSIGSNFIFDIQFILKDAFVFDVWLPKYALNHKIWESQFGRILVIQAVQYLTLFFDFFFVSVFIG